MLIWNRCYIQLRHFLFLPERGEFVPKLAAVSLHLTGGSLVELRVALLHGVHSVTEWEWVGCGLELGLCLPCLPWLHIAAVITISLSFIISARGRGSGAEEQQTVDSCLCWHSPYCESAETGCEVSWVQVRQLMSRLVFMTSCLCHLNGSSQCTHFPCFPIV